MSTNEENAVLTAEIAELMAERAESNKVELEPKSVPLFGMGFDKVATPHIADKREDRIVHIPIIEDKPAAPITVRVKVIEDKPAAPITGRVKVTKENREDRNQNHIRINQMTRGLNKSQYDRLIKKMKAEGKLNAPKTVCIEEIIDLVNKELGQSD